MDGSACNRRAPNGYGGFRNGRLRSWRVQQLIYPRVLYCASGTIGRTVDVFLFAIAVAAVFIDVGSCVAAGSLTHTDGNVGWLGKSTNWNEQKRQLDVRPESRELEGGKVIGGAATNRTAFPHQVLLSLNIDGSQYTCGGTLIDRQYVITAAHCTFDTQGNALAPSVITAEVGSEFNGAGRKVRVIQVWRHENFSSTTFLNDVALLKLSKALEISSTVTPIKLSFNDNALVDGSDLTISGWGTTRPEVDSAIYNLNAATVDYRPNGCGAYQPPGAVYVPTVMVCAGCTMGEVDTCYGDSGGPATTSSSSTGCPILVGITSFGAGCALPQFPGVYTRASAMVAWAEKKVGRVFRSQYPIKPTKTCDTCAGATLGRCGLAPGFNATRCQLEAYLSFAFNFRLRSCARGGGPLAGGGLLMEALFKPASYLTYSAPNGTVYFLQGQVGGGGATSTTVRLGNANVIVPLKGPVISRSGSFFTTIWRYFWMADRHSRYGPCDSRYSYVAAYVSSDGKFVQVSMAASRTVV